MNSFKKINFYCYSFLLHPMSINFDLSVKRIRLAAYTQPSLGIFYFFSIPVPPLIEVMEPLHVLFLSGIALFVISVTALFRFFFKKDPDAGSLKKSKENLEENPPAPVSSPKLTDEQFATLNFVIAFPDRVDELSSKVKDTYEVVSTLTARVLNIIADSERIKYCTPEEIDYFSYVFTALSALECIISRDIAHMTSLNPKLIAHMEPKNVSEDEKEFQYTACTSDYWKKMFIDARFTVDPKIPNNLIDFRPGGELEGVDILASKVFEYVFHPEVEWFECLLLKQELFDQLANCNPAFTTPQDLELVKNKNEYCVLRSSLIQPLIDIYSLSSHTGTMRDFRQIPSYFPDLASSFFKVDTDGAFRNVYMTLYSLESRIPEGNPRPMLKDSAVRLPAIRQRILDTYFDADQKTLSPNTIKEISPFLTDFQKRLFSLDIPPSPDTLADTSSLAKSVANVIKELL